MADLFSTLMAAACAYPLFWLHSFDAEYRIRVYERDDIDGPNTLDVDERPSLFSLAAAIWAVAFAFLHTYSGEYCTLERVVPLTIESAFGVLCIAATAKVLFGSATANHKRLALSKDRNKLVRPVRWRFLDFLTAIPVNVVVAPFTKLIWFPIFGVAVWVLNGFSLGESRSLVPHYAFLAGALLVGGRLSSMYLKRAQLPLSTRLGGNPKTHFRGAALATIAAVCLLSFFLATSLLEGSLLRCGALPDRLPSYSMLLAGLASMPLLAFISTATAAIAVSISSSIAGN